MTPYEKILSIESQFDSLRENKASLSCIEYDSEKRKLKKEVMDIIKYLMI